MKKVENDDELTQQIN